MVGQSELNLEERWSGSLTVCTWYCPSYLSNVPSHTVTLCEPVETNSAILSLSKSEHFLVTSELQDVFTTGPFHLDSSASWLDWILWPWCCGAPVLSVVSPRLSAPLLQRQAGRRDRWPAMFLALVVTPELREFLARARGGAVRLIKVRIQDGEWPKGVRISVLWLWWVVQHQSSILLVLGVTVGFKVLLFV